MTSGIIMLFAFLANIFTITKPDIRSIFGASFSKILCFIGFIITFSLEKIELTYSRSLNMILFNWLYLLIQINSLYLKLNPHSHVSVKLMYIHLKSVIMYVYHYWYYEYYINILSIPTWIHQVSEVHFGNKCKDLYL